MKEIYDNYEGVYEKYADSVFEELNVDERLLCIQMAMDNACELLEKLVDCAKESLESAKEKEKKEKGGKKAEFSVGRIGADIGEEVSQGDVIARIFGNV